MPIPKKGHDDAITIGIRDDEKEISELNVQFDMLLELLQGQRHGWVIKQTVKWAIQQLMERR